MNVQCILCCVHCCLLFNKISGKRQAEVNMSKARLQNVHMYTCPETAYYHGTLYISYFNIQNTIILSILIFFMVEFKTRNCQRMHTNLCNLTQQITCVHEMCHGQNSKNFKLPKCKLLTFE